MSQTGGVDGVLVYWTPMAVIGLRRFDGEHWTWESSSVEGSKKSFWGLHPQIQSVFTHGEYVFIALHTGTFVCLDVHSGGCVWSKNVPALKGELLLANKARRQAGDDDDDSAGIGLGLGMFGVGAMIADD